MRVYVIDISGRVVNYDLSLCRALLASSENNIKLLLADAPKEVMNGHVIPLIRLVPGKFKSAEIIVKRLIKATESFINYLYIFFIFIFKKPDIIHFQWLPFSEICSLELPILRFYRLCFPKSKKILTIHNVYPHNYGKQQQIQYRKRFVKLAALFDGFIVHTENTKREVAKNFSIEEKKIRVIHHGIFEPDLSSITSVDKPTNKYRLISYGHQDPYKGTDLLLDAVSLLPKELKDRIELSIVGRGNDSYLNVLKQKGEGLNVDWKLFFVDDKTLYQEILKSDAIVLPYRNISQSGVLLLALFFDKPIICSDLPAFVETLEDYPSELFFKTGDVDSLKNVIINQLTNRIDDKKLTPILKDLRKKYSWDAAGLKTIKLYKELACI